MNKKALLLSTITVFLASAASVYAQQEFVPLTTIDGVFEAGVATNPVQVLSGIYGFAIGIGAVIAIIMIIVSGFQYMYQESIFGKSEARERIINAFLGLGVILASFIILRTINKDLVNFNIQLPGAAANGQLGQLIDSREELDIAVKQLRDAQKDSLLLKSEISALQDEIAKTEASSTISVTEKIARVKELNIQKGVKVAQEATVRGSALSNAALKSIQNYVNEDKKDLTIVLNTEGAIARGMNSFKEQREALQGAYLLTNDQKYQDQITELNFNQTIFKAESDQMLILAKYKERGWLGQILLANEEGLGQEIKKIGESAVGNLRAQGKTQEADELAAKTIANVKKVCPTKCN